MDTERECLLCVSSPFSSSKIATYRERETERRAMKACSSTCVCQYILLIILTLFQGFSSHNRTFTYAFTDFLSSYLQL